MSLVVRRIAILAFGGVTARERYVEDFGLLLGQYRTARMLGRVLAALLVSDPPECAAEELARALRASRGSISSAMRSLLQMGLVERMTKPGERRGLEEMRTFYAFWESELPAALARWEKKAKGGR